MLALLSTSCPSIAFTENYFHFPLLFSFLKRKPDPTSDIWSYSWQVCNLQYDLLQGLVLSFVTLFF